jgi:uncharacterized protein YecT (DUF1311 family)
MRALLFAAALLVPVAARADECDRATTQNRLNTCAEDRYKQADKELNDTWRALPDATKTRFRQPQRDWIAARDAKCKSAAAEAEGGSMQPLLYFGCLADQTKERTRWLKAHAG